MPNCIYHGPVSRDQEAPLHIDLPAVLTKKLGARRMKYVPDFVVRRLEKIICVPELNALLAANAGKEGAEFARGILSELNVKVDVRQVENLPPPSDRRVLFISNHPMGGIEGMAMIDFMNRYYGGQVYVMVNDILMAVEPLQSVFVPVNKHGRQGKQTLQRIDQALDSNNPCLIFPAGWVSRLQKHGRVSDYKWYRTFINKAIEHKRTIIPMFCTGKNSMFFYRFAKLREFLKIKLNVEMVRLPREVLLMRNKTLTMICGKPVDWRTLRGGAHADDDVERLRRMVYAMEPVAQ